MLGLYHFKRMFTLAVVHEKKCRYLQQKAILRSGDLSFTLLTLQDQLLYVSGSDFTLADARCYKPPTES